MPRKTKAVNIQVWNMNGGPLPESVVKALTELVEGHVKDSDNPRLLTNVTRA